MKTQNNVLITTEFRGVFFGIVKNDAKLPLEITLTHARNCIYWSNAMNGFLGLASVGPDAECKLGQIVEELTLYKITSVTKITDIEVVKKWKI